MKEFLEYILARAASVPGITESRIFNNQIQKMTEHEQFLYPMILVEVERVDYLQLPNSYQTANVEITLHIVHESPLQGEELEIYDLKDLVQQYMNRFSANGILIEMTRQYETLDRDHDMLYDYRITYFTQFRDFTPPVPIDAYDDLVQTDLNLKIDLDIDNPVVRTGDNKNYTF